MSIAKSALYYSQSDSDLPVRIPEGEYQLKLLQHQTSIMYGTPKLKLVFSIINFGEYQGLEIEGFYNVMKLISKQGLKGKMKHKARGDFMIEYCSLLPDQKVTRLDKIPLDPLYKNIIIGKVVDVKVNSQQKKLPEQLVYSKVSQMLRIER